MKYFTYITSLFQNLLFLQNKKKPIQLGRWYIDYCDKKINRKIDYSNEDHCGPCGQYKKNITSKQIIIYEPKNKN